MHDGCRGARARVLDGGVEVRDLECGRVVNSIDPFKSSGDREAAGGWRGRADRKRGVGGQIRVLVVRNEFVKKEVVLPLNVGVVHCHVMRLQVSQSAICPTGIFVSCRAAAIEHKGAVAAPARFGKRGPQRQRLG